MKKLKVAFLYNKKPNDLSDIAKRYFINTHLTKDTFAEWDSERTIKAISNAIAENFEVIDIEADIHFYNKLLNNRPDIAFNFTEGFNYSSREAQVPAVLDFLNIPYTGSNPETLINCLDKIRTKEILIYNNIPTAKFSFFKFNEKIDFSNFNLNFPVIVKPAYEGSSKGIFQTSVCYNHYELKNYIEFIFETYKEDVLIEEFLEGREFTIGFLGNDENLEILPIIEISFPENIKNKIYSYELKWELDTPENPLDIFKCPAIIDENLMDNIINIIKRTISTMRLLDWGRIDIRLDKNNIPNIIEINPIPGILPKIEENSCFTKAAFTAGYKYSEIIKKVILSAASRWKII